MTIDASLFDPADAQAVHGESRGELNGERILDPPADPAAVVLDASQVATCAQCGTAFTPRRGGRRQRFCSSPCRLAFHGRTQTSARPAIAAPSIGGTNSGTSDARALAQAGGEDENAEFWSIDDPDVLLWCQPSTTIYLNRRNQVVIRQESDNGDDDDTCVLFNLDKLPAVIDRLRSFLPRGGQ